jgi:hypothetical protein
LWYIVLQAPYTQEISFKHTSDDYFNYKKNVVEHNHSFPTSEKISTSEKIDVSIRQWE